MSTSKGPSNTKNAPSKAKAGQSNKKPATPKPTKQEFTPLSGAAISISQRADVLEVLRPVLAEGMESEALVRIQSLMRHYQGPIPPASEFAAYEAVMPGAGSRILTMAETDQANTFKLNDKLITAEWRLRLGGQLGAAGISLALFGLTLTAMFLGHVWLAALFGSGTAIAVTALFLGQNAKVKNGDTEIEVSAPNGN